MLKFSPANAKIKELKKVKSLAKFLKNRRKVYSFDLLSGWSCPAAKNCLSKVIIVDGKRKIKDGPDTTFRCFSASQEVLFPAVYNLRKHNFDVLRRCNNFSGKKNLILSAIPKNAGIIRIHVGGDFFNRDYFHSWAEVAKNRPDILFYAYTKSLNFWNDCREFFDGIDNFVLTASWGGKFDHLIVPNKFRSAKVIHSVDDANGLAIDHDDSHAADPDEKSNDFVLLIHGSQPKGSDAGKAVRALNGIGSYGRGTKSAR